MTDAVVAGQRTGKTCANETCADETCADQTSDTELLGFATEALLCANVGDECSYLKNLRKLSATDSTAQKLLRGYEWVHTLRKDILRQIDDIRCLGSEVLSQLLTATVHLPTLQHMTKGVWGYCCVTGALSANTVQVQHESSVFCADARFEYFLCSLWVASNIPVLEASRLAPHLQVSHSTALSERIANILHSDATERQICIGVYKKAVDHAMRSLHETTRHIMQSIHAQAASDLISAREEPRDAAPSAAHQSS